MMKVEVLQDNHLESLISFLINFEDEYRSKEFWTNRLNNWWHDNPFYNSGIERGWVLISDSEKIVGFIGNIPMQFLLDGKLKIGVSVLDVKSLLNKRMLGVVKDDPSCIKCGTRFPQGFRRVVNGYIYKTKKEVLNKDDGLDSSFN